MGNVIVYHDEYSFPVFGANSANPLDKHSVHICTILACLGNIESNKPPLVATEEPSKMAVVLI